MLVLLSSKEHNTQYINILFRTYSNKKNKKTFLYCTIKTYQKIFNMKNLRNKKLSREQLKSISGNGPVFNCTYKCCPEDGRPLCPGFYCPDVICPN
ncbi:hypothetical protein OK18_15435 [Chryseobacterium gallinarum]|uniref:Bacteriocin n=2 Tax=Chryseobacterium gallinarum TaxID=1324352 RepID=A0A0G3M5A5_CHRGL|nr:hypothetical protein OK18_15435 [Chryseobacterium gallinarum]